MIILEILDHGRLHREYRRFEDFPIRIGRGYGNDFIVGDPYVCANHIVIDSDEGGWFVEDISSDNGILIDNRKPVVRKNYIQPGAEIRLGYTQVRVLDPDCPVKAALSLSQADNLWGTIPTRRAAFLLVCFLTAMDFIDGYFESSEAISAQKYFWEAVIFLMIIFLWVSLWAFIGRLILHRTRFAVLLCMNSLFVIFFYLTAVISSHLGFIFSSGLTEFGSWAVLFGTGFSFLLIKNLAVTTRLSFARRLSAALGVVVLIYLVGSLSYLTYEEEFNPVPIYYRTLKPPYVKPLIVHSPEKFLKEGRNVFQELNKKTKNL